MISEFAVLVALIVNNAENLPSKEESAPTPTIQPTNTEKSQVNPLLVTTLDTTDRIYH